MAELNTFNLYKKPGPAKLYLVEVLTYGATHPIKVGITQNLKRRMSQFNSIGIETPNLLGYFEFPSMQAAYEVEQDTVRRFPRSERRRRSPEILDASKADLIAFIAPRAPGAFIEVPAR